MFIVHLPGLIPESFFGLTFNTTLADARKKPCNLNKHLDIGDQIMTLPYRRARRFKSHQGVVFSSLQGPELGTPAVIER